MSKQLRAILDRGKLGWGYFSAARVCCRIYGYEEENLSHVVGYGPSCVYVVREICVYAVEPPVGEVYAIRKGTSMECPMNYLFELLVNVLSDFLSPILESQGTTS